MDALIQLAPSMAPMIVALVVVVWVQREVRKGSDSGAANAILHYDGRLKAIEEKLEEIRSLNAEAWEAHNVKDSNGVYVWHTGPALTTAVEGIKESIDNQTKSTNAINSQLGVMLELYRTIARENDKP